MSDKLTHIDQDGQANMVDVGSKPDTERLAIAEGFVTVQSETLSLIQAGAMKKGDVLTVARLAGIMGAKKTSDLIPLCHPLPLTKIDLDIELLPADNKIRIVATAKTIGKTGVEMEALTAVSVACLTIYDMAKAVDREMQIGGIRLLEKHGGSRGSYVADDTTAER